MKKLIKVRKVKNKPFRITKFFWLGVAALVMIVGIGMIIPFKPSADTLELAVNASSLTTVDTKKQIEGFKTQMLDSWQEEAKQKGILEIPKRYQGVTLNAVKPNNKDKIIALTFDDGPWPKYTEQVLNILKANNVKGTFFVIGNNMKNMPEVGKRIVTDGHTIANHTWNHWYHRLSPSVAAKEINDTEEIIYKVTGVRTNLFRPPGGVLGNGPAAYASSKKYSVIMWSADSNDYKRPAPSRLLGNVMRFSKPGGIVLMHDGGGVRDSTVKALPEMIKKFKQQGYRFVTIPEMLELEDQQLALASK